MRSEQTSQAMIKLLGGSQPAPGYRRNGLAFIWRLGDGNLGVLGDD